MKRNIWTGSPFNNPGVEKFTKKKGLLSWQVMDIRDGVDSLRKGLNSRDIGYVPLPYEIELLMEDGTRIHGNEVIQATSINSCSGDVRIILIYREDQRFHWSVVQIVRDVITVTSHRNPVNKQLTEPSTLS